MTISDTQRADRIGVSDRSSNRVQRALRFVREKGVGEVYRLVRTHGAKESLHFVARNIRHLIASRLAQAYDRRYGVDTAGSIQLDTLSIVGGNAAFGNECVCSSPKSFAWIMRSLPQDLSQFTFIDIGAGKSRTLLLASAYRFLRVTGVEFARELVAISRRNLQNFRARNANVPPMDISEADAVTYDYPTTPLVVYFYNPFGEPLFDKVFANLEASLAANPRPCYVVYATSSHGTMTWAKPLILRSGRFTQIETPKMPFYFDAVRTMNYALFRAA